MEFRERNCCAHGMCWLLCWFVVSARALRLTPAMRVLIVGCGYVGLPLGAELVKQGHEVFGLRRSGAANVELIAAGIHPLSADITRPGDLAKLPAPFEWVVNTVYTSSTSVYAQTDGSLVKEDALAAPQSPTSRLLVETESLLLQAARERNFPAVILRVAGIYGPERGHLFQQYLRNEARIAAKGERFLNMIH